MSGRDEIAERREAVARAARAGMTVEAIAAQLGVTDRTVTRDRVALGIAAPGPKYVTPEQWAVVERLLDDGASLKEAALTIGASHAAVCRKCKGRGWTKSDVGAWGAFMRRNGQATRLKQQEASA